MYNPQSLHTRGPAHFQGRFDPRLSIETHQFTGLEQKDRWSLAISRALAVSSCPLERCGGYRNNWGMCELIATALVEIQYLPPSFCVVRKEIFPFCWVENDQIVLHTCGPLILRPAGDLQGPHFAWL